MAEKKVFRVQIPQSIVRSTKFNAKEFVMIAKLIQVYYMQSEKSLTFKINYTMMKSMINIKDNETFKKCLLTLYDEKIILKKIDRLPRTGVIKIELNEDIIPEHIKKKKKKVVFTQLTSDLLTPSIVKEVGHVGIRLMYYYKSYINAKDKNSYCFVGMETTAKHLKITKKTIITYNDKLKKKYFLKIEKHKAEPEYQDNKNGNEVLLFEKWNNHYTPREENIEKYAKKKRGDLLA